MSLGNIEDRGEWAWGGIYPSEADKRRFMSVISGLAPHFRRPIIVTGSFAVEWNLRQRNGDGRERRLSDIDLVLSEGPSGISSSIAKDFLIHHFHPMRETGNVFIQLVEPQTGTRVDVFSPRSVSVRERVSTIVINGTECEVVAAEDLIARLLAIASILLDGESIDPKYIDSLERLMGIADRQVTAALWGDYRRHGAPVEFCDALEAVRLAVRERPELLKEQEYSTDPDAKCQWCIESPDFPLAERSRIFELIGYV
jgi:hypothetical protein